MAFHLFEISSTLSLQVETTVGFCLSFHTRWYGCIWGAAGVFVGEGLCPTGREAV